MATTNLTAARLRELLDYDAETGAFKHKSWRPGKPAGSNHGGGNGHQKISVDGKQYFAQRLAWLHHYGAMPTGQVHHIDGNGANNRINNLRDVPPGRTIRDPLTAERAREMLSYSQETGLFAWRVSPGHGTPAGTPAGSLTSRGYRTVFLDGIHHKAHRLAWLYVNGSWPVHQIDHINGDKADNRIANLRDANSNINAQNKRKPMRMNKAGFLGVTPNGRNFMAQLTLNGERVYLGTYATAEEAHAAYVANKRILHPGCTL